VTRLHLVRHGRAAAGWDTDVDPDLDDLGWAQAHELALRLASVGPDDVITSPLLRCRSTAAPLCAVWQVEPIVEPVVSEIPSPHGVEMGERVAWLREVMTGSWAELGARYVGYRDRVVARLAEIERDTVVFSHFVAINAVIGHCLGDDRLVIRSLDNCSVTIVDVVDGAWSLVETGREADTLIR
jgi:broad specificity phosphatase PhoE